MATVEGSESPEMKIPEEEKKGCENKDTKLNDSKEKKSKKNKQPTCAFKVKLVENKKKKKTKNGVTNSRKRVEVNSVQKKTDSWKNDRAEVLLKRLMEHMSANEDKNMGNSEKIKEINTMFKKDKSKLMVLVQALDKDEDVQTKQESPVNKRESSINYPDVNLTPKRRSKVVNQRTTTDRISRSATKRIENGRTNLREEAENNSAENISDKGLKIKHGIEEMSVAETVIVKSNSDEEKDITNTDKTEKNCRLDKKELQNLGSKETSEELVNGSQLLIESSSDHVNDNTAECSNKLKSVIKLNEKSRLNDGISNTEKNDNETTQTNKKIEEKKKNLKQNSSDKDELGCATNEKSKTKVKRGIFSNFKTTNLLSNSIDNAVKAESDTTNTNDKISSSSTYSNLEACDQLSEKIRFLKLKSSNKPSTTGSPKTSSSINEDTKLNKHDTELREDDNSKNKLENMKDGAESTETLTNQENGCSNDDVNGDDDDDNLNGHQCDSKDTSSSSNEENLVTNSTNIKCPDKAGTSGIDRLSGNDLSLQKKKNTKSSKNLVDTLMDSDDSSDNGNFKRNAKISNGITEDNEEGFFSSADEDLDSSDSLNKWESCVESSVRIAEESHLPGELYCGNKEEDEEDLMNRPISPLEEEKSFWDSDVDDEASENEEDDNDQFRRLANGNDEHLLDEKDVDTDDNSELCSNSNTTNFVNINEINCDVYNNDSLDDDDDQLTSDFSEFYDEEEEEDGLEIVGFSVNREIDFTERGYPLVAKIENEIKIPKCYVKRDPDPSEMVEVKEMETNKGKESVKNFGESFLQYGNNYSSIVSFGISEDLLRHQFCPYILIDGSCTFEEKNCEFTHQIPQEILMKHPFTESWMILQFIFNRMIEKMNIQYSFLKRVFLFLGEKFTCNKSELDKSIENLLMFAGYIPFVDEHRKSLWKMASNVLTKTGIARWTAAKQLIKYQITFLKNNIVQLASLWGEMLDALDVDTLSGRIWDVVECLVEPCDYTLPGRFLTAALVDVANNDGDEYGGDYMSSEDQSQQSLKLTAFQLLTRQLLMTKNLACIGQHELHVFLEKASHISELIEPVNRIRKQIAIFSNVIPIVSSYNEQLSGSTSCLKRSRSVADLRELGNKKRILDNEMSQPVYEKEKSISALARAMESNEFDAIIRVLRECSKKSFFTELVEQLYTYIISKKAYHILKNVLSRLSIEENQERCPIKLAIGRVIVSLMLHFVKSCEWQKASHFLMMSHSYKLNPITIETIVGECSQVRKAVTCSEIHYHNGHLNSAIKVLINYKLFKRECWILKGAECDILIVERMCNYLLKKLIETKEYDHAIALFKAIFQELGEDQGEIELMNFYEELLHGLFEEEDIYGNTCIELYLFVNEEDPTIPLCAVTLRTLLILAHKLGRDEIALEIFEKCIKNYVYPSVEEKDCIIKLHKCLLEEEMEIYVTKWFTWFLDTLVRRRCDVYITFTNDSSEDFAMNSRFGMPKLLKLVDTTKRGALRRLRKVLKTLSQHNSETLRVKLENKSVVLGPDAVEIILNSPVFLQETQ